MHSVLIHKYAGSLSAIEFGSGEVAPDNFVVFIGGLGDGFLTVPYVPTLADAISIKFGGKWAFVQALISSSYLGFGTGSLQRDVQELGSLVRYLRQERGTESSKVILMGHSTGSQDTMEYLTKFIGSEKYESIMEINGAILQAPVSDSEGICDTFKNDTKLHDLMMKSRQMVDDGEGHEMMPAAAMKYTFGSAATAYRFNSLLNPRGDDDYFSSYLESSDFNKSFGLVTKPLLVLYSGNDEFVPKQLNKKALVERWKAECDAKHWSQYSKIIRGGTHNLGELSEEGALKNMIDSVLSFVENDV